MKSSLALNVLLATGAIATWGTGGSSSGSEECCCEEGSSYGWKRTHDKECEDSSSGYRKRTFGWGGGSDDSCDCSSTTTTTGGYSWGFPTFSVPVPSVVYSISWGYGGGGASVAPTEPPQEMTTSTIYATSVHTVTSCAPEVTNCPGEAYTTVTIAVSTTICPVTPTTPPEQATTTTQSTTLVTGGPITTQPAATSGWSPIGNNATTTSRPAVVTAAAAPNAQIGGGLAFAAFVAAML